MKPDVERGLWGAWARRQRSDRDWSVDEVVQRLATDAHMRVDPATIRGVEGGSKKPSLRLQDGLALIYGSRPETPQRGSTEPTVDVAEAIREQTAVMRELVDELRAARGESISPEALTVFLRQLQAEGWLTLPGTPSSTAEPRPRSGVK